MIIDLGNLSDGMGKIFMREFMQTADQLCCSEGQVLFRKGEATQHFYTLIHGEFSLTAGINEQLIYTVCHPGDIFGWSSLVGRGTYSATAVCTKLSEILRFDHDSLLNLLIGHPESGLLFFKKLAETLGERLLESYRVIHGDLISGGCDLEAGNFPVIQ